MFTPNYYAGIEAGTVVFMTSTDLLELAGERQSEINDAVAAYLAKGGEIKSCPKKNPIKANLDYYKHRARARRAFRNG